MNTHILKTWPQYFDAVARGEKTFELRKNDRDFQAGDALILRRYDPSTETFTGEEIQATVTYVLLGDGLGLGLEDGYCVLSFHRDEIKANGDVVIGGEVVGARG